MFVQFADGPTYCVIRNISGFHLSRKLGPTEYRDIVVYLWITPPEKTGPILKIHCCISLDYTSRENWAHTEDRDIVVYLWITRPEKTGPLLKIETLLYKKKVKSSMENLLPQNVGSIINYLQ